MSNAKETNPAAGLTEYPYAEAVEGARAYFGGDDLAATVWVSKYALKDSFGKIYEKSPEQMETPSHILEHVARRIIDAIRFRFPQSEKIRVKVSKLAPPLGGKIEKVSVTLEE